MTNRRAKRCVNHWLNSRLPSWFRGMSLRLSTRDMLRGKSIKLRIRRGIDRRSYTGFQTANLFFNFFHRARGQMMRELESSTDHRFSWCKSVTSEITLTPQNVSPCGRPARRMCDQASHSNPIRSVFRILAANVLHVVSAFVDVVSGPSEQTVGFPRRGALDRCEYPLRSTSFPAPVVAVGRTRARIATTA
jgi:hypothetical protein